MYTNDARITSLNGIRHHKPRAQETSGGKLGTLTNHRHASATLQKCENLDPRAIGQWAAHDTLPQALQHDLVMNALLKQMAIHRLTKKIHKLIKTHYARMGMRVQMNLILFTLTHFPILSCKCFNS